MRRFYLVALLLCSAPAWATYTHIQGTVVSKSGTSGAMVLGAAPTLGNTVACGFLTEANAVTALAATDSNSNAYTVTASSPTSFVSGAGQEWMVYLNSAPSNASATINFSWTTSSSSVDIWCDEFHSTVSSSFDKDAAASPGSTGTTINTPSITPAGSNELLYACGTPTSGVTAPAAGATLGVWKGAGGAITGNAMCEYDLSASSATAVNFTVTSATGWAAMAMAFEPSGGVSSVNVNKKTKLKKLGVL